MFKEQVKHQYLKAEITPALHFCVQSWHELVLLSPAVKRQNRKLYSESKKYLFYEGRCRVIHPGNACCEQLAPSVSARGGQRGTKRRGLMTRDDVEGIQVAKWLQTASFLPGAGF